MYLEFDDNWRPRLTTDKKKQISKRVVAKFAPAQIVTEEKSLPRMVRPIEDLCRHCTQRAPFGKSPYCAKCIQLLAQVEENHFWNFRQSKYFPGAMFFLFFGVLWFLLYLAMAPSIEPKANFQRSEINATANKKR